jgi:DUF971 family protein
MDPTITPVRIDVKKDRGIEIQWSDGNVASYPLSLLRIACPCALCKEAREKPAQPKSRLTVLPGNYSQPMHIAQARLVGNYALKIEWSDNHDSGIYSFTYLRTLTPPGHAHAE